VIKRHGAAQKHASVNPGTIQSKCRRLPRTGGGAPVLRLEVQSSLLTLEGGFGIGQGVARKLRIQYPGEIYHVMNRGDQREAVFRDEQLWPLERGHSCPMPPGFHGFIPEGWVTIAQRFNVGCARWVLH